VAVAVAVVQDMGEVLLKVLVVLAVEAMALKAQIVLPYLMRLLELQIRAAVAVAVLTLVGQITLARLAVQVS
jgi:hypothetical protein